MRTVNMHEAKTHLSKLVDAASKGEPFIIAKAGKPMVRVVAIDAPDRISGEDRLGFMEGEGVVPDDIKSFCKDEIEAMFYGNPDKLSHESETDKPRK